MKAGGRNNQKRSATCKKRKKKANRRGRSRIWRGPRERTDTQASRNSSTFHRSARRAYISPRELQPTDLIQSGFSPLSLLPHLPPPLLVDDEASSRRRNGLSQPRNTLGAYPLHLAQGPHSEEIGCLPGSLLIAKPFNTVPRFLGVSVCFHRLIRVTRRRLHALSPHREAPPGENRVGTHPLWPVRRPSALAKISRYPLAFPLLPIPPRRCR